MRQAVGWAWLAISARWSVVKGTAGSESRVEMTVKPAVASRARRRVAKARVRSFSRRLLGRCGSGVGASVGGVEEDDGAVGVAGVAGLGRVGCACGCDVCLRLRLLVGLADWGCVWAGMEAGDRAHCKSSCGF